MKLRKLNTVAKGFTLIELMIIIAIIGILAALIYPNYQRHIRTTNRKVAIAKLHEISQVLERGYTTNNGTYSGINISAYLGKSLPNVKGYTFNICRDTNSYQLFAEPIRGDLYDDQCDLLVIDNFGGQGIRKGELKAACGQGFTASTSCFR